MAEFSNDQIGSVFAVQRDLAAAHPDVAVHEAGIGQTRSFVPVNRSPESRHSPELDGKLPFFRSLAPSGYRFGGGRKINDLLLDFRDVHHFLDV